MLAPLDRRAFEQELIGALPELRRLLCWLCRDADRAEDVLQSATVRALEHWTSYRPDSEMIAWLWVIAKRIFINEKRKAWSRRVVLCDVPEQLVSGGQEETITLREVDEFIRYRLTRTERRAITLLALQQHSVREAKILAGVGLQASLSRARAKLRAHF